MVRNYQNAHCILKINKFIVLIIIIFGTQFRSQQVQVVVANADRTSSIK